jgi:hypothetical protein
MKTGRSIARIKGKKASAEKLGIKRHILVLFCIVVVALGVVMVSGNLTIEDRENGKLPRPAGAAKLLQ